MKTAIVDVETTNLNPTHGWTICAVVMNYNTGKLKIFRIDQYKTYGRRKWDDKLLIKSLIDELRNYDVIVTYNGTRFDKKWISTLSLYWGIKPLGEVYHVDVYKVVKRNFKMYNYKLQTLINYLNSRELEEYIVEKTPIDTINYKRAITGDKKGIDYVVDHCKRDVEALTQIYDLIKPYINRMPRQIW